MKTTSTAVNNEISAILENEKKAKPSKSNKEMAFAILTIAAIIALFASLNAAGLIREF